MLRPPTFPDNHARLRPSLQVGGPRTPTGSSGPGPGCSVAHGRTPEDGNAIHPQLGTVRPLPPRATMRPSCIGPRCFAAILLLTGSCAGTGPAPLVVPLHDLAAPLTFNGQSARSRPDEKGLAVNWLEAFEPLKTQQLSEVRRVFRLSVRPNGRFAELHVGTVLRTIPEELTTLRILHDPLEAADGFDADPSHAQIDRPAARRFRRRGIGRGPNRGVRRRHASGDRGGPWLSRRARWGRDAERLASESQIR